MVVDLHTNLNKYTKMTYLVNKKIINVNFGTQKILAEEAGCSEAFVCQALKGLRKSRLAEWIREKAIKNHGGYY